MAWSDDARLVDVSHWNPEDSSDRVPHRLMDWDLAVKSGVVGAIVKYSQGQDGTDPAAYLHAYNAWRAGVPLLGAYHFGDGSDPEAQAEHFLDLVKADYGTLDGVMLMLDAERNRPQMTIAEAETFVSRVHDVAGRWPWLYMGRSGPDGTGHGLPSAVLSNCRLLLPAYGDHPDLSPVLPMGWRVPDDGSDCGEPGTGVVRGWQFTDGRIHGGPFPGLGRVDQSKLIGVASLDEARAIWAS